MGVQHKVGLVLSGGGIKGAAHIGMLKALKERNIEPTIVAGTSAGAIVGAMYAANLDEETMLDYFTGTSIFNPANYTWKKPGLINTDALEKVLLKIFPENSFEALHRPLHIVATDITLARQKVFSSGELVKPLLASACFPVVFSPVEIGDSIYADGGILNNFPTEPIRQRCDKLIGINVQHIEATTKKLLKSTLSVFQRIYFISTRFASVAKYQDCDLVFAPESLNSYNTFDMFKIKEVYEKGYEDALKVLSKVKDLSQFQLDDKNVG